MVDVTRNIAGVAGTLAARHLLRGFDAVHLASAAVVRAAREISYRESSERGEAGARPSEVRLMTYDSSLLAAARREGLAYEPRDAEGELE